MCTTVGALQGTRTLTSERRPPHDAEMADDVSAWIERASQALAQGDLLGARDAAEEAIALDESPTAQELLGALAMTEGRFPDAGDHWEDAFRGYRRVGDLRAAARVAIALARLHAGAFGRESAAQGWAERARVLLERVGPCVEWGLLGARRHGM
jgi:hypothetical protein